MAVTPTKPIKDNKNKEKMKEKKASDSVQLIVSSDPPDPLPPSNPPRRSPAKRTKCPGFRVIGRRVYDSENGKTCHQCRQKTMDFVAACKNQKNNCTSKFCHKCLMNRYGEEAEVVEMINEWHCPKCRGICNCSFCMKKRGQQPTGMLIHTAKATGFSSVSQMLHLEGPGNVGAPKKRTSTSSKENVVSKSNNGTENSVNGNIDSDLSMQENPIGSEIDGKKIRKLKQKMSGVNDKNSCNLEDAVVSSLKRNNYDNVHEENNDNCDQIEEDDKDIMIKKSKTSRVSMCKEEKIDDLNDDERNAMKINNAADVDIPLPRGVDLNTIAGTEIPSEDAGHALQFLEFCNAFGQVLDLKKGQSESILQELTNGCSRRRGQYSLVIQIQIQLLSLIQKDMGEDSTLSTSSGENSWLQAFEKCLADSNYPLKELPSDCFAKDGDGYNKLDPSQKLRLLNFLCDETLGTTTMRNWIDDEKVRFAEREKYSKEKVAAAKEKERELKRKKQDEVAKAILSKNAPLSISEHEDLVSKIKAEAAKAHAETLEAIGMVPKRKQRSDAVRTEPILLDGNGNAFWRLTSYSSEPIILLQDIGNWESVTPEDKWFSYNDDVQKQAVEDYISSIRRKRIRMQHEDAARISEAAVKPESSDDKSSRVFGI